MSASRRAFLRLTGMSLILSACQRQQPAPPQATSVTPIATMKTGVTAPTHTQSGQATATLHADYASFAAFAAHVQTRRDAQFFYVESDGIPTHPMMIGIRRWQQQVPMPQHYTGTNAWQFPLTPTMAETPISATHALYRGAIAIAANGVPIFNALNNRGEDAFLIGELVEWGGHCGQGDDYHYHVAPLHLQAIVGDTNPIAYALDGFPIYGDREPDGSPLQPLDEFNGHTDANGDYHYHGTTTYPYINGGLSGVVTSRPMPMAPRA